MIEDVVALLWESPVAVPAVLGGLLVLSLLFVVTRGGRWPE